MPLLRETLGVQLYIRTSPGRSAGQNVVRESEVEQFGLWFLEGQSSQRDVIRGARAALDPHGIGVVGSHRHPRPEITGEAHLALQEPEALEERLPWVLATAQELKVRVVVAGRGCEPYEAIRVPLAAAGIRLYTGLSDPTLFPVVNNKALYTHACQELGIPVARGLSATTPQELVAAIEAVSGTGAVVCIKPAVGIYGHGFWILRPDADPYSAFANADSRTLQTEMLIEAYGRSANPPALLVMPYLPGPERSVDMVCERGGVITAVARRKEGALQHMEQSGQAFELALRTAESFACDGILNIQTRDDANGIPHLLEINTRASGGIGYTRHSGINLAGHFACHALGLPLPDEHFAPVIIRSVTESVRLG